MRTEPDLLTCPGCGMPLPDDDLTAEVEAAHRKIENLQTALQSARRIGAAIGILMERMKITMDEAFNVLVFISQHEHRKLREIAEELVFTGVLPDASAPTKTGKRTLSPSG